MKHTPGKWKAREVVHSYNNELVYTRIDSDNKTLGFAGVYCDDKKKISVEEAIANAKLIADAGNTTNKCGLLPSELLTQRDELLEGLQAIKNLLTNQKVLNVETLHKAIITLVDELSKKATE